MRCARRPCVALLVGLAAGTAWADSNVSLTPAKDNTLYQPAFLENNSNGAGSNLFGGVTAGGSARRAVLEFNVASAVPAGATITSATLSLNINKSSLFGSETVSLYRLSADWGEGASNADAIQGGGGGAPAQPGDASWTYRFSTSDLWSTPGGDFSTAVSSSTDIAGLGVFTFPSTSQLVADVQSFLNSPSGNFGWIILGDEANFGPSFRMDSRESATPSLRPTLSISYVAGAMPGDANNNGVIDDDDFALIDRGFARHLSGFANGDFNGDGVIDSADYLIIDNAFLHQGGSFDAGTLDQRVASFGPGYVSLLSVPEPGALAVAGVALISLLRWRGRGD